MRQWIRSQARKKPRDSGFRKHPPPVCHFLSQCLAGKQQQQHLKVKRATSWDPLPCVPLLNSWLISKIYSSASFSHFHFNFLFFFFFILKTYRRLGGRAMSIRSLSDFIAFFLTSPTGGTWGAIKSPRWDLCWNETIRLKMTRRELFMVLFGQNISVSSGVWGDDFIGRQIGRFDS